MAEIHEKEAPAAAGVASNPSELASAPLGRHSIASVAAGVGLCVGLALGFVVGRAGRPEPASHKPPPRESRAAGAPAEKNASAESTPQRPEFRLSVGSNLPEGPTGSGWVQERSEQKPVARMSEAKSTIRFDVAPKSSPYAVSVVARLEGSESGTLAGTLNGKELTVWQLSPRWQMYSVPIPAESLKQEHDELSFVSQGLSERGSLLVDSVIVAPVGERLELLAEAPESAGHFVDGFEGWRKKPLWTLGKGSVVAGALEPRPGAYRLSVVGGTLEKLAPLNVSASINGKAIGTREFQAGSSKATWDVPPGLLVSGANSIELTPAKTGKPSEFDSKSKDQRDLALRVRSFKLKPAG